MATVRVSKSANYSCINNQPIRDVTLTWAARGLLIYLLSMPDDWTVKTDQLVGQSPGGVEHVWSLLRELEAHGYVSRNRKKDEKGRWQWEHIVREVPTGALEIAQNANESPYTEKPDTDNAGIYQVLNNQVLTKERTPLPPNGNGKAAPTPIVSNDLPLQPVPPFNSVEFNEILTAFRQHRREIKEPLTPLAEQLLFKKLAKWPESVAIEALENSILNRWRGVFEPKHYPPNGNRPLPTQAEMNAGGRGKLVL